jgi:hypothetical protein
MTSPTNNPVGPLPQACGSARSAPPSVLSLGTTARRAESHKFNSETQRWSADNRPELPPWTRDPEWVGDLEYVWSTRTRRSVASLDERAKRYRMADRRIFRALDAGAPFEDIAAPGPRRAALTKTAARNVAKKNERFAPRCRTVVDGEHGAIRLVGRRIEILKAAEWCESRARATSMSRVDVVGACRGRWRAVKCGCGTREIPVGCDQPMLCGWCRARHFKAWRRRIVRAMGPHLKAAVAEWSVRGRRGPRPGIFLITLTGPHSGDFVDDRKAMGNAWRELSKRASYGGYHHNGKWFDEKWWGHHALVWEATPGTEGDGHLHGHVAVISQWVPYAELHAAWSLAMPGAVVVDVVSPADHAARMKARGQKANGASDAAKYLAKYVTKGIETAELTGRKAGELLVAFRNKRKVTTSRHFWRPAQARDESCKTCGECHRSVGSPISLQEHVPGAVLSAWAERSRWKPPRGAPQVLMRWTGATATS